MNVIEQMELETGMFTNLVDQAKRETSIRQYLDVRTAFRKNEIHEEQAKESTN